MSDARDDKLQRLEALATLGRLGAGVSHEVRNIMTGLIGFAQVARHELEAQPAQAAELLGHLERELQRCLEMLTSYLRFSREGGAMRQPLELPGLIADVARLVGPQLRLGGVKLAIDCPSDLPAALGDAQALRQVLLNLVVNAMQAMPSGGEVRVTARVDGGRVMARVHDDGPGVPTELAARIFEPFFTTKPDGVGTGLGLSVSRDLVEAQGGTLALEASARGACFVIGLPLAGAG
jgi:two-component system NtrC family sensor kinase